MMFLFKKRNFKRQNRKKVVYIAFDIFNTILFPCPNFWRNVIINGNLCFGSKKFSDRKVKSGIINQYYHIRFPLHNVVFAQFHVAKDGAQVKQNGNKPHISHFTKMFYAGSTFSLHQVASPKAKLGLRIYLFKRMHQMRGVKIARGFANNEIIFHN